MAKRKNQLADKLGGGDTARPGWRDTILPGTAEPEPEPQAPVRSRGSRPRVRRKTYLLPPELIDQIDDLAAAEQVGISELVIYLLRHALEQVEAGQIQIPTRPARRKILQRGRR